MVVYQLMQLFSNFEFYKFLKTCFLAKVNGVNIFSLFYKKLHRLTRTHQMFLDRRIHQLFTKCSFAKALTGMKIIYVTFLQAHNREEKPHITFANQGKDKRLDLVRFQNTAWGGSHTFWRQLYWRQSFWRQLYWRYRHDGDSHNVDTVTMSIVIMSIVVMSIPS